MVLSEILQCIFLLLSKFFKPKQEIIGPNFQNEMTNVKSKNVNARRRWRIVIIKSCIDYNKKWCHNWNTYQNIVYISLFIRHDTFNGWSIFKNSYVTLKKNPSTYPFPSLFLQLHIYHSTHSLNIQRRDRILSLDNDILPDSLHHSLDNDKNSSNLIHSNPKDNLKIETNGLK